MEEIYIVKLKGLSPPSAPSHDSLSKDSKASFYYHTDLTAEAIRGFSYLHIFFGITVLSLSVTNLCFHENPLALEPPLGITVWCAVSFILLGFFGILTAYKRKCDLSGSIFYVKFQLILIIIVLSLTLTFAILFALDLHGPIANQFIGLNIIFSIIVESVILLLTLFTCARVLWPGCLNFCAKDWPMQPSLKRKMIIKTKVFANGIQQDKANIIQSFGPNCVISLNMPPTIASDHTLSSKNSSICSSPIYKNNLGNNKRSSLSGSTSDLTKSLSTIYALPDEQIDNNSIYCKEQITAISTNSIYYNYPVIGVSTTNLLQTFPTVRHNREQLLTTNDSKMLSNQQSSPIMYINDTSTNNSDHSWYRGSDLYSASEETDPYDTDEFDYCSTEDEIETADRTLTKEFNKMSSDDGNGTLEDESISNSSTSSSSKSEANNDEEMFNDCNRSNEMNNESMTIEAHSNNESNSEISSIKKVIDFKNKSTEMKPNIDQEAKNDYEQNVEPERFPIQLKSFCATKNNSQQVLPYKKSSIIQIQSSTNPESNVLTMQDVTNLKSSKINESSSMVIPTTTTTTTIRLLNTNKTASNHNRLNINENDHVALVKNQNLNQYVTKMGNKLTSHPYLCRLRATNDEAIEQNSYSKKAIAVSKQIPDIQRV
ncbi:LOW QUALITY PROTEIN: uncharacterized protein LOC113797589 [Dermatophagoides pteronyssinus]|uniref:Filamentous growth regulator 23-like n=1 Tax=Dermatophagoides pteronyssinus TaxID=6956 RepID=A0A6P6YEU1_DERPT|nr:filamentous growth regulator 23-like [Dermatophagoides pteronyssinus]XP_027203797.1 filamentous growth regulator 23-like [Dermatophagoides pteronyssinus]